MGTSRPSISALLRIGADGPSLSANCPRGRMRRDEPKVPFEPGRSAPRASTRVAGGTGGAVRQRRRAIPTAGDKRPPPWAFDVGICGEISYVASAPKYFPRVVGGEPVPVPVPSVGRVVRRGDPTDRRALDRWGHRLPGVGRQAHGARDRRFRQGHGASESPGSWGQGRG